MDPLLGWAFGNSVSSINLINEMKQYMECTISLYGICIVCTNWHCIFEEWINAILFYSNKSIKSISKIK